MKRNRFSVLAAACALLLACNAVTNIQRPQSPAVMPVKVTGTAIPLTNIHMKIGYGVSGSWFELYFTDPADSAAKQMTGGLDVPLVASLDAARVTIDMAAYSLNLKDVEYALLHARQRGVQVRLVMESDNMKSTAVQTLIVQGIPVVGDGLPGLMHDKFVVIDRNEVWTGSMNFTESGTYKDNNNLMHIHSSKVAEDYEMEFNQMFIGHRFGTGLVSETPYPSLTLDGTPINIYFSPADHVQSALLPLIDNAKFSIYFLAYAFTADSLGNAIRQRAADGVKVEGVMEADQVKSDVGSEYAAFQQAGLDVRLDGNPGLMHHKVILIDDRIVIMGSYNFTASAENNNEENLVVIDNPQIAAQFIQEFQRVYSAAQP